jgi:hypothetical protein
VEDTDGKLIKLEQDSRVKVALTSGWVYSGQLRLESSVYPGLSLMDVAKVPLSFHPEDVARLSVRQPAPVRTALRVAGIVLGVLAVGFGGYLVLGLSMPRYTNWGGI